MSKTKKRERQKPPPQSDDVFDWVVWVADMPVPKDKDDESFDPSEW